MYGLAGTAERSTTGQPPTATALWRNQAAASPCKLLAGGPPPNAVVELQQYEGRAPPAPPTCWLPISRSHLQAVGQDLPSARISHLPGSPISPSYLQAVGQDLGLQAAPHQPEHAILGDDGLRAGAPPPRPPISRPPISRSASRQRQCREPCAIAGPHHHAEPCHAGCKQGFKQLQRMPPHAAPCVRSEAT